MSVAPGKTALTLIPSGRYDHHSQFGETKNPRVQLMADANNVLITTPAITTFAGLETALRARWTTAGIALARQPDIANVLDFQAGPRRVVLRPELLDRFNHISTGNENGATPIVLMNYPFIASTLVAHGLFSEVDKTGLWIPACYNNGRITYRGSPLRIGTWTTGDNPHRDITGIKISAVQIAQFMTLAAQGRMIDSTTSQAVLTHLNLGGCVTSHADLTSIAGTGRISAKCGFVGDVSHDPIYFKASTGPREFVAVLLTKNNTRAIARTLFPELLNLMP